MAVRVTGAAVQVVVDKRAHLVLAGGLLPDGTSLEDVERLVRKGLVVIEDPEPAVAPESAEEAPETAEAPEFEKTQARKPAAK